MTKPGLRRWTLLAVGALALLAILAFVLGGGLNPEAQPSGLARAESQSPASPTRGSVDPAGVTSVSSTTRRKRDAEGRADSSEPALPSAQSTATFRVRGSIENWREGRHTAGTVRVGYAAPIQWSDAYMIRAPIDADGSFVVPLDPLVLTGGMQFRQAQKGFILTVQAEHSLSAEFRFRLADLKPVGETAGRIVHEIVWTTTLQPAAALIGRAIDGAGTPIRGALGLLVARKSGQADHQEVARARSDLDGSFALHALPASSQALLVLESGKIPVHLPVRLALGSTLNVGEQELLAGAAISGQVLGLPAEGTTGSVMATPIRRDGEDRFVVVASPIAKLILGPDGAVADGVSVPCTSAGEFLITGLHPREYHLHVNWSQEQSCSLAGLGELPRVTAPTSDVVLQERRARIRFEVTSEGHPVGQARIEVSAVEGEGQGTCFTAWTGRLEWGVRASTEYRYRIEHDAHERAEGLVLAPAAASVTALEIGLIPLRRGDVELLVDDAITGAPVRLLSTTILRPGEDGRLAPGRSWSTRSERGLHRIEGLAAGPARIRIQPWSAADLAATFLCPVDLDVDVIEGRTTRVPVKLDACGTLELGVASGEGDAVRGAFELLDASGAPVDVLAVEGGTAYARAGRDHLPGPDPVPLWPALRPGAYTVEIVADDDSTTTRSIAIEPGQATRARIVLPRR